jgi:hypothetical protein
VTALAVVYYVGDNGLALQTSFGMMCVATEEPPLLLGQEDWTVVGAISQDLL